MMNMKLLAVVTPLSIYHIEIGELNGMEETNQERPAKQLTWGMVDISKV